MSAQCETQTAANDDGNRYQMLHPSLDSALYRFLVPLDDAGACCGNLRGISERALTKLSLEATKANKGGTAQWDDRRYLERRAGIDAPNSVM